MNLEVLGTANPSTRACLSRLLQTPSYSFTLLQLHCLNPPHFALQPPQRFHRTRRNKHPTAGCCEELNCFCRKHLFLPRRFFYDSEALLSRFTAKHRNVIELMATFTASSFASTSPHVSYGTVSSGSNLKTGFKKIVSGKQTLTHNGLRALNSVDELRVRIMANSVARQTRGKSVNSTRKGSGVIVCGSGMNLVFLGTEVGPWSKTGGLGDVLGGLPPAMAANGHRVMTISPRYDQYKDAWDTEVTVEVCKHRTLINTEIGQCSIDLFLSCSYRCSLKWEIKPKQFDFFTATNEELIVFSWITRCFSKRYGGKLHRKFMVPLLESISRTINLGSACYARGRSCFIANDWHTALLPCYLKAVYKPRGIYSTAKVAFCIHNIAYQGRFAFADFALLNLPDEFKSSFDFIDGYEKPVKGRKINWMKAGILESDKLLTVSPYYAEELVSAVEKGVELDNIIRKTGIFGIVNGMDVQEWNPLTDKYTTIKYDASTVADAKPLLKETLQAEVGLPVDRDIPVIGFIGRLEEQKGSDILIEAIPHFVKENVQIIVLGTGKKPMEKQLEQLEIEYPEKARGIAKFSVPLAHMITAGADFMLVSSRFEPCGLIQLHAMRYGTVPIVASTGGLVDTVKEGFTGFHMGAFNVECEVVDPADAQSIATTVTRALGAYGTPAFTEIISNCMAQDLSWKGPGKKWEQVLLSLDVAGSEPGIKGEEIAPLAKENVATP